MHCVAIRKGNLLVVTTLLVKINMDEAERIRQNPERNQTNFGAPEKE